MKLKDWAKKEGISYQTAYRWFKSGNLPVKAYQSESGTIIVQDEEGSSSENTMNRLSSSNSDAMSHFLKKTVEFSKANCTIEDFAAYVIANFQLKINPAASDMSLKYSKNKPSQTEINKHFQQFIKPKQAIDKVAIINNSERNIETLKQIVVNDPELKDLINASYSGPIENAEAIKNFVEEATSSVFNKPTPTSTVMASSANNLNASIGGTFFSSGSTLDFSSLPVQNINVNSANTTLGGNTWTGTVQPTIDTLLAFQPTPRELESFRAFTAQENLSEKDEHSFNVVKKQKRGRPKRIVK